MKLLFDANLSPALVDLLNDLFPDSKHIFDEGDLLADDPAIWEYAKEHGFVIITKDSDFHHMSFVHHAPPKVVWLRIGNASTGQIEKLIRHHASDLVAFADDSDAGFLIVR